MRSFRVLCSATRMHWQQSVRKYNDLDIIELRYLLNDIGAELLNRKSADVANELANDGITEPVIIEVEDILHDLTNETQTANSPFP
jgi:hypothetical protein